MDTLTHKIVDYVILQAPDVTGLIPDNRQVLKASMKGGTIYIKKTLNYRAEVAFGGSQISDKGRLAYCTGGTSGERAVCSQPSHVRVLTVAFQLKVLHNKETRSISTPFCIMCLASSSKNRKNCSFNFVGRSAEYADHYTVIMRISFPSSPLPSTCAMRQN